MSLSVARWAPRLPVQELLRSLTEELLTVLARLWDPASARASRKQQQEVLRELKLLCNQPFDAASAETGQALCDIWNAAFPGRRIETAADGEHWKLLGFQSSKPHTDVRAGRHTLDQMRYLAREKPELLQRLVEEAREAGYPLACACFNVSHLLADFFHLREGLCVSPAGGDAAKARPAQMRRFTHFCGLCEEPGRALDELFCALMERLHRTWLDMQLEEVRLNLLGFSRAMKKVHAANSAFWQRERTDLEELRELASVRDRERAGAFLPGWRSLVQRLGRRGRGSDPPLFGSRGTGCCVLGRSHQD